MTAERLLLAGQVRLNGSEPQAVELWASDSVAVAFAGATKLGVLTSLTIGWDDERRLRLTGLDPEGMPTVWQATDPERITTRWTGAKVAWPDGRTQPRATVSASQHGVTVNADGETTHLPGARLAAVGSQRWIIDGDVRFLASDGRGCGCGGKR